jgi:putative transposase
MNTSQTAVTNAATLAFFLVLVSKRSVRTLRNTHSEFGILDLKAYFYGYRYFTEIIQLLAPIPDILSLSDILRKLLTLGSIHASCDPMILP